MLSTTFCCCNLPPLNLIGLQTAVIMKHFQCPSPMRRKAPRHEPIINMYFQPAGCSQQDKIVWPCWACGKLLIIKVVMEIENVFSLFLRCGTPAIAVAKAGRNAPAPALLTERGTQVVDDSKSTQQSRSLFDPSSLCPIKQYCLQFLP